MSQWSIGEELASGAKRSYRSELRARQAGETRRRIVSAAAELFAELGYSRTTFKKIAGRAGVSPETVQSHGPKAALIRAATEQFGLGVEGVDNALELPAVAALLAMPPEQRADAIGPWLLSLHQPLARVLAALIGGTAEDPELAEYYREIVASIRWNWGMAYDHDLIEGWVRADRPREQVVDVWCMTASPEAYLHFSDHYGWSAEQYARYMCAAYRDIWLGPTAKKRR